MPLTFAHPAAVIPLRRRWLPLSALIVGSIAPDLEYLMHLSPHSVISHTIVGLFLFCIPMGLITLWIFHQVWKKPLLALIAKNQGHPPAPFTFWPLSRLAILATAVFIGALTHVVWDSFTHQYGWMIQQIPALSTPIFQTRWGEVPLYKLLQHGSTALGLAVLAVIAIRHHGWMRHISPRAWGLFIHACCSSAVAGIGFARWEVGHLSNLRAVGSLVGISIIATSVVFIAEVTLWSLIWHVRGRASMADQGTNGQGHS